ncbi:MAG: hypothetical protein RBS51_07470 [Anaerovoracaceae bacterium]|nr:hypothetical protein [Anaerovoracaceae bacterium]
MMRTNKCILCKNNHHLKEFHGGYICEDCYLALYNLYKTQNPT